MAFDERGRWRPLVAAGLAGATLLLTVGWHGRPEAAHGFSAGPPTLARASDALAWAALLSGLTLAWFVATRSAVTRILLGIWLVTVSIELLTPRSTLEHPLGLLTAVLAYILAPVVWALDGAPRNDQSWATFRPVTSRRSI